MGTDEKLLQLLKYNWDHGRHLENLRMKMAAMYTGGMLMLLLALFRLENIYALLLAELIGIMLTIVCVITTYKWNFEFKNQIQKADKCAHFLSVKVEDRPLLDAHSFLGFPIRAKHAKWLNVRLTFILLYGLFLFVWIIALLITCLKIAINFQYHVSQFFTWLAF